MAGNCKRITSHVVRRSTALPSSPSTHIAGPPDIQCQVRLQKHQTNTILGSGACMRWHTLPVQTEARQGAPELKLTKHTRATGGQHLAQQQGEQQKHMHRSERSCHHCRTKHRQRNRNRIRGGATGQHINCRQNLKARESAAELAADDCTASGFIMYNVTPWPRSLYSRRMIESIASTGTSAGEADAPRT